MKQLVHPGAATAASAPTSVRQLRYLEIKVRLAELVQANSMGHADARSILGILSKELGRKTGIPEGKLADSLHVQQSDVSKIFVDVLGAKGAQAFIDFTHGLPLTDPLPSQP